MGCNVCQKRKKSKRNGFAEGKYKHVETEKQLCSRADVCTAKSVSKPKAEEERQKRKERKVVRWLRYMQ